MEKQALIHEPATVIYSWQVLAGKDEEFMEWLHGITKAAVKWPGHLGVTTLRPPGGQGPYHSVLRFDTEAHLNAWLDSPERDSWIARLDGIAVAHRGPQATGLESWFEIPDGSVQAPPRWKMVAVTFVAVYPLSLLVALFVSPYTREWNIFARAIVFPIVAPVLLTYVLMPFLTQRVFRKWLYK